MLRCPATRARHSRRRFDEELPLVLPCFRLMLPDGALFTEEGVPIPVVIVADLRAMADQLPAEAQRIRGISCLGLALDGSTYLTRHSFEQIGERNPTLEDLSHPAWQWDEQAVQSTNQRMEGLAINAQRPRSPAAGGSRLLLRTKTAT